VGCRTVRQRVRRINCHDADSHSETAREQKRNPVLLALRSPAEDGAIFCTKCGSAVLPSARLTNTHEAAADAVPQVRPWVRYWARMFDLAVYTLFFGVLIGIFLPETVLENTSGLALDILVLFTWIFFESLLLAFVGTTPGKALFRIRLRIQGCDSIPFLNAFYRSLRVWWRGFGAGLPLVSVFTLWHAETVLEEDGITSWDKDGVFEVTYKKIGIFRAAFGVVFLVLFHGLIVFEMIRDFQNLPLDH